MRGVWYMGAVWAMRSDEVAMNLTWAESDAGRVVTEGIERIVADARRRDGWQGVRSTADALLAMDRCLPNGVLTHARQAAVDHLVESYTELSVGCGHWEQEVWDTAVALYALVPHVQFEQVTTGGVAWLLSLQTPDGCWNEEPWETMWAMLALERARAYDVGGLSRDEVSRAAEWLLGFVDCPSDGMVVNRHYSALFLVLASELDASRLEETVRNAWGQASRRVSSRLLSMPRRTLSDGTMWTDEVWSSGLVLWGLSSSPFVSPAATDVDSAARQGNRMAIQG